MAKDKQQDPNRQHQQQAGGRDPNQPGQQQPGQQQPGQQAGGQQQQGRQQDQQARQRGENLAGRQDISGTDLDEEDNV